MKFSPASVRGRKRKEGRNMKKNTSYTIKRIQRLPVILIGEGLLTGLVSGLIVMLYRIARTYAGRRCV